MTTSIRADSVTGSTSPDHGGGRGSIPASALFYRTSQLDEASSLVKKFHYSHRVPSNIQFVGSLHVGGGLFGDHGKAVAAAFFSIPPTRWSEPVIELSRLVRDESVSVPLSFLIARCCSTLRNAGNDLLISFADAGEGHHGGVYQSSNWNYHGQRERCMDGLIINGTFVPGRSCNSIYGTRSPEKLSASHPAWEIRPHFDIGKHLYWKSLGPRGDRKAGRLKLISMPYPTKAAA